MIEPFSSSSSLRASTSGTVYMEPSVPDFYIEPKPVPGPSSENSNVYCSLDDNQLREAKYNNRRLYNHIQKEIKYKIDNNAELMIEMERVKTMLNEKIMEGPSNEQEDEIYRLRDKRKNLKEQVVNGLLGICKLKEVQYTLINEQSQIDIARRMRKEEKIRSLKKEYGEIFKNLLNEVIRAKEKKMRK